MVIIKDIYKLNCDSMFSNINGKSGKSFDNFKYWDLNTSDENSINKEVSFENMFKNTSFDLFKNGTTFIFGSAHEDSQNSENKFNLHSIIKNNNIYFSGMFSNTCTSKYYELYLGIYSSIYNEKINGIIEWDSSLTSNMLDTNNMTNGGCYYIYSPARGRMSWIYALIKNNYESWNLTGINPYYDTDI